MRMCYSKYAGLFDWRRMGGRGGGGRGRRAVVVAFYCLGEQTKDSARPPAHRPPLGGGGPTLQKRNRHPISVCGSEIVRVVGAISTP
jgi:hypothetical protein